MAREFNIKTLASTESITDLHVTVTTTFQDLLVDFTYTELLESESLFVLLSDANIVAEDENGDTISGSTITPTERTKLSSIESGATADQSDAEIKTAYENNADTNAFTDAESTKLGGVEASATADQSDSEIETAYNNQVSEISQAEAEAGVGTTVRRWNALRVKQAIAALSGGGSVEKIACCPFGAKSDSTGKFLIANGKSSDADDSTKPKTRQPIAEDGKLVKLIYKTKEADSNTQMKIHINGVVEQTVNLTNINANFGGVEVIDVDVVAGDYVEIEYDGSQKPGECTMYFIQELS